MSVATKVNGTGEDLVAGLQVEHLQRGDERGRAVVDGDGVRHAAQLGERALEPATIGPWAMMPDRST